MEERAGTRRPMDLDLADEWGEWCRTPEQGMYVAPASNGREWHGLHFISSGVFAGAVFAFAIKIPAGYAAHVSAHSRRPPALPRVAHTPRFLVRRYPDTMPRCRFFTTVLHPEVRDQELDLSCHAAEWSTSKHKLILVSKTTTSAHLSSQHLTASRTCAFADVAQADEDFRGLAASRSEPSPSCQ
jgi:ubiquitin-protein ligase